MNGMGYAVDDFESFMSQSLTTDLSLELGNILNWESNSEIFDSEKSLLKEESLSRLQMLEQSVGGISKQLNLVLLKLDHEQLKPKSSFNDLDDEYTCSRDNIEKPDQRDDFDNLKSQRRNKTITAQLNSMCTELNSLKQQMTDLGLSNNEDGVDYGGSQRIRYDAKEESDTSDKENRQLPRRKIEPILQSSKNVAHASEPSLPPKAPESRKSHDKLHLSTTQGSISSILTTLSEPKTINALSQKSKLNTSGSDSSTSTFLSQQSESKKETYFPLKSLNNTKLQLINLIQTELQGDIFKEVVSRQLDLDVPVLVSKEMHHIVKQEVNEALPQLLSKELISQIVNSLVPSIHNEIESQLQSQKEKKSQLHVLEEKKNETGSGTVKGVHWNSPISQRHTLSASSSSRSSPLPRDDVDELLERLKAKMNQKTRLEQALGMGTIKVVKGKRTYQKPTLASQLKDKRK